MRSHLVSFAISLLIGQQGFAQSLDSSQMSIKVEKTEIRMDGNTPTIVFADSREARIFIERSAIRVLKLPMILSENSCDYGSSKLKCEIHIGFANTLSTARWTKHPDPKSLNKVVRKVLTGVTSVDPSQNDSEDDSQVKAEGSANSFIEIYAQNFPDLAKQSIRIVCPNLNWALGAKDKDGLVKFSSISGESANVDNEETGKEEPGSSSEIYNSTFRQTNPNTLEFVKTDNWASEFGSTPFISEALLFVLNSNKKVCQVSFKTDIPDAIEQITNEEYKKYVQASRRLLKTDLENSEISYLINEILTGNMAYQ